MPKQISETEFLEESKYASTDSLAYSYNKETTLSKNTKLVIVGTLTPPGTSYFYCSFYNRIYGYIDESLKKLGRTGHKTLKELKRGLQEVHNKHIDIKLCNQVEIDQKVNSIKDILDKNGIAFLDVMDKAIRKKKSSYDNDIEYFTLAKKDFEKISPSMVVIANSKLAKECAIEIGIKNLKFLSQRFDKKIDWIKAIIDAIE